MRKLTSIGSSLPPRLRWYVLAVVTAGLPVVAAAALSAERSHTSADARIGIAIFVVFALLAEWRPVPIDPAGKRLVSLAFVFVIASRLTFGWEWSVLTGALCIGLSMAASRAEPLKVAFNSATYALAAGLSSLPLLVEGSLAHHGYASLALSVVLSGATFVIANVFLVCLAMGLAGGLPVRPIFEDHLRHSGPTFGIMVFVAAQAVIFWRLSPPLVLLLGAPLFALTLYQRSSVRHRVAEEAAATDSLTGLKNRRAFEEESSALLAASSTTSTVALLLIDVDRFKQVNDRHGHLTGTLCSRLFPRRSSARHPAAASGWAATSSVSCWRAPPRTPSVRCSTSRRVQRGAGGNSVADRVTISGGIALHPLHADDLHSLKKRADMALYQSKYNGRDCATVYSERRESEGNEFRNVSFPMVDIRLVTARRLAALVDAFADASAEAHGMLAPNGYSGVLDRWRNFDGNHSQAVASLAVELAQRLGIEGDELEDLRLAAVLHDIGKVAVPEHILNKPGPLTDVEQALVERHPVIGYELVRGLALSPVDTYVLHHHERWDGAGYPHGLKGAEIPFGSRILFVADAFDVLTSTRSYRAGVSVEAAMNELQSESGRQFDPLVVAALHDLLAHQQPAEETQAIDREPAWSSSMSVS